MQVSRREFGTLPDGQTVYLFSIENPNRIRAEITNYGGILHALHTPDLNGVVKDITIGYDHLDQYLTRNPFFGAIVGRFSNRIAAGRFPLDEKAYQVSLNKETFHLHGGFKGFDKVLWTAEPFEAADHAGLKLTYTSPDGEEGYPGNLDVTVTYTLDAANELQIDYLAATDMPTVINLTNHTYFNLTGDGDNSILAHELMLNANQFTEIDESVIPTGNIRDVEGTPLDFRTPIPIGARIDDPDPQLVYGGGYDHNWVLNTSGNLTSVAARVYEPVSNRIMEVFTTQPGMQFYAGNNLDGSLIGKAGKPNRYRHAFCLETQHFPDAPNHPNFPSTILRPDETYHQTSIYKFGLAD